MCSIITNLWGKSLGICGKKIFWLVSHRVDHFKIPLVLELFSQHEETQESSIAIVLILFSKSYIMF